MGIQKQNPDSPNKKRTRVEVIFDILRIIQEKGGKIKPTHLMYKANLSHISMKVHLENLIKNGLIKKNSNPKENKNQHFMIEITPKGINFCNEYNQVKEFEKTFGI